MTDPLREVLRVWLDENSPDWMSPEAYRDLRAVLLDVYPPLEVVAAAERLRKVSLRGWDAGDVIAFHDVVSFILGDSP